MFRAHVLIIRRSKFIYTASGIITPIGGRLVHEMHGQQNVKRTLHVSDSISVHHRESSTVHTTIGADCLLAGSL